MFELLYTSVSSHELLESELMDILESARRKNLRLGVTGMLIYHDREILQILEGKEADVKALFQTIFEDERHTSAEVFYQGKIEERAFSDWSMGFTKLSENHINKIESLDNSLNNRLKAQLTPIKILRKNTNRGKKMFLSLLNSM